jgi:hypothetical protein
MWQPLLKVGQADRVQQPKGLIAVFALAPPEHLHRQ